MQDHDFLRPWGCQLLAFGLQIEWIVAGDARDPKVMESANPVANLSGFVNVRIGDIGITLSSEDPDMKVSVAAQTEAFLVNDTSGAARDADARVTASWGDLRQPPPGDIVFDTGGLWRLFRAGTGYAFRFTSPTFGEHAFKEARFNSDFTQGEVTLHADYFDRSAAAFPLEYPLDELLMTNLLARGRGVEVHALGLQDADGRGFLFLGHSGAGKTTTARLWEQSGVLILSDDRIILRQSEGQFWMYGTPWHGEAELAAAFRTELSHIFILGRGPENELVPLAPLQAVSGLFTRSFVPFYHPESLGYTLEFLERLAAAVPCSELRFAPDSRVVDFIREYAL